MNDGRPGWHPDPVMHDMRMVGNIVGGVAMAAAVQQQAQAAYQTQVAMAQAAQAAQTPIIYAAQADLYALNAKIAALTVAVERLQAQLGQPVTV
jgi:hypothetical protein